MSGESSNVDSPLYTGPFVRGIDVSDVQETRIDFAALAGEGVAFSYHRCGRGNGAPDPNFPVRTNDAMRAALIPGAYHVFFPLTPSSAPGETGREPEAQAKAHYEACGGLGTGGGEGRPMVDLEWPVPGTAEWVKYGLTGAMVRDRVYAYLCACEELYRVTPILYDGFPDYWKAIGGHDDPRFARFPLWVACYPQALAHVAPVDASLIEIPPPWKKADFWQHTGGGMRLPGSGAPVDGDVFCGDLAALRAFVRAA